MYKSPGPPNPAFLGKKKFSKFFKNYSKILGQVKNVPKAEPAPKPVYQKEPVVSPKSVPIEFNSTGGPVYKEAPKEDQSASILASRMSGGYSGWSAPPTVFKEKTLLEIEEEERLKKLENQNQNQEISWSPKDDARFEI